MFRNIKIQNYNKLLEKLILYNISNKDFYPVILRKNYIEYEFRFLFTNKIFVLTIIYRKINYKLFNSREKTKISITI